MYLPCIIERLNQKITVANTNFAGAKYYNKLAWLVNRDVNGTSQQFPLVDEENETEIAIDDIYPLTVYHRLLAKPYSEKNYQFDVANCQMLMIVFANKDKIKMDAEALESQLISLFPKQFNSDDRAGLEGITDISIKLGTSNLSATDVFNSEYRGARLAIDRNTILFSVRYDINITFKRDCLNFCEAVSQPNTLCEWIELASWSSIEKCMSQTQLNEARAEICTPATAVLKNTALTTISTTSIAGGLTATITAPDATAVVKNSANTTLDTELIPSGVSENIVLADVNNVDTDGSIVPTPAGVAFTCSPCAGLTVNFSANDTTPETNQVVTFTDTTPGATTWLWDFGDGNLSDLQNPTHAYKYAGTYTVTLHADNGSAGGYEEKVGYIVVTLQTLFQTSLQMWNKAPTGASPSNMTLVAGAVSQWNDEINGYDRTQGTAASRPTYNSTGYTAPDGTVYGTVEYDGANDGMKNNSAGLTRGAGSYEVILVRIRAATNGTRVYFEAGNASLYESYLLVSGGVIYSALVAYQSAASSAQSAGIVSDEWVLVKIHWNGASSSIQIDNLTKTVITNNIGTGAAQGSTQGATQAGTNHGKVDILEHAIYSAKPSDADVTAYIDNYFNSKFGLWE